MGCFESKEESRKNPMAERGCTDICWLVIFVFFWIILVSVNWMNHKKCEKMPDRVEFVEVLQVHSKQEEISEKNPQQRTCHSSLTKVNILMRNTSPLFVPFFIEHQLTLLQFCFFTLLLHHRSTSYHAEAMMLCEL